MIKNITKIICCIGVIVFTGCASGPIDKLPIIADQKLSGEVIVLRISNIIGATNSYIITLNGKDIFGIRSGQYTTFKLTEGEHYIGIKCFGGWSPTWKEDSVKFTVTRNSNSYFIVSPNLSCAIIKPIVETEAQKIIKNSKYVSMEQQ
jgi:hypothetical protein